MKSLLSKLAIVLIFSSSFAFADEPVHDAESLTLHKQVQYQNGIAAMIASDAKAIQDAMKLLEKGKKLLENGEKHQASQKFREYVERFDSGYEQFHDGLEGNEERLLDLYLKTFADSGIGRAERKKVKAIATDIAERYFETKHRGDKFHTALLEMELMRYRLKLNGVTSHLSESALNKLRAQLEQAVLNNKSMLLRLETARAFTNLLAEASAPVVYINVPELGVFNLTEGISLIEALLQAHTADGTSSHTAGMISVEDWASELVQPAHINKKD